MALRAKLLRTFLAVTLLACAGSACKKNVKKTPTGPDPDTNSGPDAKRGGAKAKDVKYADGRKGRFVKGSCEGLRAYAVARVIEVKASGSGKVGPMRLHGCTP